LKSYTIKRLQYVITLDANNQGGQFANGNQITLDNLRSSLVIERAGMQQAGTCKALIYGIGQSDMDTLTTLRTAPIEGDNGQFRRNLIEIYAFDGDIKTLIFKGDILNSWADYNEMPNVCLRIQGNNGIFDRFKVVKKRSYPGPVDIVSVFKEISDDMGAVFENNGVVMTVPGNLYLPYSNMENAQYLAKTYNINFFMDDDTFVITPPGIPRTKHTIDINSRNGLVCYPIYNGVGVIFTTLFNRLLKQGATVVLDTDIKRANGKWRVASINHHLESNKPDGAWFTEVNCNYLSGK